MASPNFVAHCLELLAPLGAVRAQAMFGGHGLYCEERFFGLIARGTLYLKVDAATQADFAQAGGQAFTYGRSNAGGPDDDGAGAQASVSLGYWSVPPHALDSSRALRPWADLALQAAARAPQASRRRAKKSTD